MSAERFRVYRYQDVVWTDPEGRRHEAYMIEEIRVLYPTSELFLYGQAASRRLATTVYLDTAGRHYAEYFCPSYFKRIDKPRNEVERNKVWWPFRAVANRPLINSRGDPIRPDGRKLTPTPRPRLHQS